MEVRRTMTMNWDGIGDLDDDDDLFFDARRLSSVGPQDLDSSSSDDEFDDSLSSFAASSRNLNFDEFQYDMWMAAPDQSITDRRRRLLQDMGLNNSNRFAAPKPNEDLPSPAKPLEEDMAEPNQSHQWQMMAQLGRSRSDGSIDTSSIDMIDSVSKQRLTRTSSCLSSPDKYHRQIRSPVARNHISHDHNDGDKKAESNFLIKNLDNGKEFEVKECHNAGNWNKVKDVQTGKHITMEEFEKDAGHSPKVKELMKREGHDGKHGSGDKKLIPGNSFRKSFKKSKKRGASLFKNIKLGSMGGPKTEKEKDSATNGAPSIDSNNPQSISEQKSSSQWVKARVHGKTYKEFTALHRSQEIQGHEGSIWAMKFTYDGRFLATAGEDKLIRIWEVQDCDVMAMRSGDDSSSAGGTPVHPMAVNASPDGRPPLPESTPEKKKKGKKKKGIPDYVHVPETVFGLSETPFCTLEGHTEDVLDLSWSRSQLLLSSSMDKTVRLWDIETKNCLKSFSHTDYVTCLQFNPANDDYFISGSLDSKVRIWNIPDRQVVDWIDLHEMVTAIGYSTDGKVSVVGSIKGICRFYDTSECKLELKDQIELKTKKKPQPKKITGIQFSACNPSEVLVTSADSRVRMLEGTKVVQKLIGYKNNNSQFLANYSHDGKYVISASEDSQVYIWRHEETRGKTKHLITKSYEHFPCKDVSVTAPWPGNGRIEPPLVEIHSKKHAKKSTTTLPPGQSPLHDDISHSKRSSPLPPLPKRTESAEETQNHEPSMGPCESFSTAAGSPGRFDELTSPSPNSKSHGHKTIQATAWGFVTVTGGVGGEIKVFQNVGLPFKVGRL